MKSRDLNGEEHQQWSDNKKNLDNFYLEEERIFT
jgi:hypothetical protein